LFPLVSKLRNIQQTLKYSTNSLHDPNILMLRTVKTKPVAQTPSKAFSTTPVALSRTARTYTHTRAIRQEIQNPKTIIK